jgi:arabinofuranosyltransferase
MRRRWVAAVALFWLAPAAYLAARFWGFAIDDFFITHRYAWNLVHGHGFVFNPGERVFGTTAPGLALLLAAVSWASGLAVPAAATVATALAWWGLATLLLVEGAERGRVVEAVVAGTYLIVCPYLWIHTGSETPVVVALLALAALAGERRPAVAGLTAGAAVWFRPDAGLGLVLLGFLLWRRRRRPPWAFGLAAGGTVAAGLAATWLWFGRFLPLTLEAKRVHVAWMPGVFSDGPRFWVTALLQVHDFFLESPTFLLVPVALAGHLLLIRRGGPATRLLALYSLALTAAYPLLGVSCYTWYLLPAVVAGIYGVAAAAGWAARRTGAYFGYTALGRVIAAALVALVLGVPAGAVARRAWGFATGPLVDPRYELYRRVGEWLREHTAPDERSAYVEVGTIGYFSERPVDDLLGLVTPRSLPYLRHGDIAGAFLARPPDLFLYHTPLNVFLDPIRDAPWFAGAYAEAARFEQSGYSTPLIVYRRQPGSSLPPPAD